MCDILIIIHRRFQWYLALMGIEAREYLALVGNQFLEMMGLVSQALTVDGESSDTCCGKISRRVGHIGRHTSQPDGETRAPDTQRPTRFYYLTASSSRSGSSAKLRGSSSRLAAMIVVRSVDEFVISTATWLTRNTP